MDFRGRWVGVVLGGVALACAAGWLIHAHVVLPSAEGRREMRSFAAEVRRRVPSPTPVLLFRTESHQLIFHLGPPVDRLMEWENLDIWLCRAETIYVVMPPGCAAEWRERLEAGRLYPVVSNSEIGAGEHQEPLVLMCNRAQGDP